MSAGAKVTIAVVVLFAVVVSVYYGFGGPVDDRLARLDAVPPAESQQGPAPVVERPQPRLAAPAEGGILSASVRRATADPQTVRAATANPFAALATDALPLPAPPQTPVTAAPPPDRFVMGTTQLTTVVDPSLQPQPGPREAAVQAFVEYTVAENDSMWTIAQESLGDGTRWRLIARANPSVDPDRLQVGQKLRVPTPQARRTVRLNRPIEINRQPARRAAATYHIIQAGETLSTISKRYYRTANGWHRIHNANRDTIGSDPDRLKVGTRLRIPTN